MSVREVRRPSNGACVSHRPRTMTPLASQNASRARVVGLATLGFSVVAALASAACVPPNTGGTVGPNGGYASGAWVPVTPASTGARLEMPKPPEITTERGRMPDGGQLTTTHGVTATPSILFQFVVTEFEAGVDGNPAAVLDDFVDEFINSSDGAEIRSSGPVDMHGFPGTEPVLYRYDDDVVVRVRQWVGRTRAYIFSAATPAREEASARAAIDRYFSSIALEPRDAPGPAGDGIVEPRRVADDLPADRRLRRADPGSSERDAAEHHARRKGCGRSRVPRHPRGRPRSLRRRSARVRRASTGSSDSTSSWGS